ncbi:MAG: glycosyltransferase family 2 protein [Rhodobacterales bacterium]|nr:glycosyltransferase family 2 protein [Rhodobacterales bacterium]
MTPPSVKTAPDQHPARKVLFSAMKNEAPFVLEWIAYHKVIGFDDIVICSNPSNDGMEEVLAALADAGEVRHLQSVVPVGKSPQIVAAERFEAEVGYRNGDWYLWLDADEFLNVHVGDRTADALISGLGGKNMLLANWRVFGSAGLSVFPGRFVSPSFVRASEPECALNLEQKAVFQKSEAVSGFGKKGLHRPLLSLNPPIDFAHVVVGNGKTASPENRRHRRWMKGEDFGGSSLVGPEDFGWALAQINHYVVRTPEFFALKRARGRGYEADAVGAANQRHTADFFAQHDRNEAEDRSILHWEAQVTREMARLRQIPAVAQALDRSAGLVRAILADANVFAAPQPDARPPAAPAAIAAVISQAAPVETPVATPAVAPKAPNFALTFPPKEAALVKEMYAKASVILEYGSGGSTLLAAKLGKTIISVESDKAWADALSVRLASEGDTALVHHVSIGPTEKWGFPTRPRYHLRYHLYALSVWDRPDLGTPDLVLIDGRFRAACLAAVRLRAKGPTTVLFDDYEDRPYYVGVEKLAQKEATIGRMVRFTVTPGPIPPEMLTEVVGWFADPR